MADAYAIYHDAVRSEDYAPAIAALGALADRGGDAVRALSLRSHLRLLAGDAAGALGDLDRAVGLAPGSGALRYSRAEVHRAGGAHRPALADLCEAVLLAHAAGDDGLIDAAEHAFAAILEGLRSG